MLLGKLSSFFPPCGPPASAARDLRMLGLEPARYSCMCFSLSLAAAALSALLLAAAGSGFALPLSAFAFAAVASFLLLAPSLERRRRVASMEESLPLFLRSLGMLIELGIPFQRALGIASGCGGPLGEEMKRVLREAGEGLPLQRGIASIAVSCGSAQLKRAVAQLLSAYETGASGREITKVGDDMLQLAHERLREHSARSAVFGLLFMASSAILPTFFLIYSLSGGWDADRTRLAMLVFFPALSALALMLSRSSMPRSAFGRQGGSGAVLLAPGAAMAAAFALFPDYGAFILAAGGAACAFLAAEVYMRERRLEEIESALPDALFSVSGMPRSSGPAKVFMMIEEGGFGPLSEEAAKSRRQLGMNNRLDAVLDDLWRRNRSPLLRRASAMLLQMVDTDSLERIGSLAEDITRAFQLERERRSLFAMQKYTLIAGAFLIPAILRIALGLLGSMSGTTGAAADAAGIVRPYLVIYSIMAAAAISEGEGRKSAAASYSVALAAASLLAFHFINI